MFSFGAIILSIIILLSSSFLIFYHWNLVNENNILCLTICNLIENTVTKMDDFQDKFTHFSLQEIKLNNPKIAYIYLIDKKGTLVAHSEPGLIKKKLNEKELRKCLQVFEKKSRISQDIYLDGKLVRDFTIPSKISGKTFLLKLGIANDEFEKQLVNSFWFLVFFAVGITALAMIYINFLSAKLSAPVKDMAQKLQGILDYSPGMIIIKDRKGTFSDISKNSYDMLPKGTNVEDTMSLFSLISKDQLEKLKADENAIFNGEKIIASREYSLRDKNDERNMIITSFPVIQNNDNQITHLCHIGFDITERIHLREQFMQAQKMESLGQLAGGISHDFNNLISVILGYTSLLVANDKLSDEAKADIESIREASVRATALVKKLMAFSRRDAMVPQKTDINLLVKKTEDMLSRLIPENINLKMDLMSYPLFVLIDSIHFEQALINLINNSVDAIGKEEEGEIVVSTSVVDINTKNIPSSEMQLGKYVQISVYDSGAGIDIKIQNKIFEPFFTTKTGNKGTGLGLSMVYGMVKQLKGDIIVESEPGKGTVFKLLLPLESESAIQSEEKQKVSEEKHKHELHGHKTILVAEDEAFVRSLVVRTLKKFNYKVIPAENGQQAVDMALTNKIDLVLTDIVMPFKNGIDAYLEIKESKPDVPCIYMSGYTAELLEKLDDPPEEVNFLQKPLSMDTLLTMVQEVLQNAERGNKKKDKVKKE